MFLLWLRQLPWCGDQTPASVPPPTEDRSSPTNTPVFLLSSLVQPSFVLFYIFFSAGQVLLSVPSWCPACTSVSEGVFLMCPWREIYTLHLPTPPPCCSPIHTIEYYLAIEWNEIEWNHTLDTFLPVLFHLAQWFWDSFMFLFVTIILLHEYTTDLCIQMSVWIVSSLELNSESKKNMNHNQLRNQKNERKYYNFSVRIRA